MAEEYGTDICWNGSTDSLATVTGDDNLSQAVTNRLNTTYEELDWVYGDYGCNFRDYLGMKNDETSLEFIKNSIKQSLEEDDRIGDFEVDVTFVGDGVVNVVCDIDGTSVELELR